LSISRDGVLPANARNGVNKYLFQGQEKQIGLDYIQFKWRLHDPLTGRFLSVDPLSEKYKYNSTYAFSENKVTGHIELEGLEAVLILGGGNLDSKGLSASAKHLQKDLQRYSNANDLGFKVKAFPSNLIIGQSLSDQAHQFLKDNNLGEPVIIYGYSLGGEEANKLAKKLQGESINVQEMVTIDPALGLLSSPLKVGDNVEQVDNFYQTKASTIRSRGYASEKQKGKKTTIRNYKEDKNLGDVKDEQGWHKAMDERTLPQATKIMKSATKGGDAQ